MRQVFGVTPFFSHINSTLENSRDFLQTQNGQNINPLFSITFSFWHTHCIVNDARPQSFVVQKQEFEF